MLSSRTGVACGSSAAIFATVSSCGSRALGAEQRRQARLDALQMRDVVDHEDQRRQHADGRIVVGVGVGAEAEPQVVVDEVRPAIRDQQLHLVVEREFEHRIQHARRQVAVAVAGPRHEAAGDHRALVAGEGDEIRQAVDPPLLLGERAFGAPVELERADQLAALLRHQAPGRALERIGQAAAAMVDTRKGVAHLLDVDLVAEAVDRFVIRLGLGEAQGRGHVQVSQKVRVGLVAYRPIIRQARRERRKMAIWERSEADSR